MQTIMPCPHCCAPLPVGHTGRAEERTACPTCASVVAAGTAPVDPLEAPWWVTPTPVVCASAPAAPVVADAPQAAVVEEPWWVAPSPAARRDAFGRGVLS